MRQYQIHYKRARGQWATLEPHINSKLYDRPELTQTLRLMQQYPYIKGAAVQFDDELFNIITFDADALKPKAFPFEEQS